MKDLKPHDFDICTDFCIYCGVPRTAVEDRLVIPGCGSRSSGEPPRKVADQSPQSS